MVHENLIAGTNNELPTAVHSRPQPSTAVHTRNDYYHSYRKILCFWGDLELILPRLAETRLDIGV